jgi:16S rRNA (adenine1518-N6/adenine1519-N6)-dimethyltransferase
VSDPVTRLLGPAEIREMAARLGRTPTKALGQNFVHDANTVRRLVRVADLDPADVVVEVGPGYGSLTCALLPACAHVYAVEIDAILAAELPATVARCAPAYADRLTVLARDALATGTGDFPRPPTALVANLPYNVAVPVVLHLLAVLPSLRHGLVMVQKEVADRLVAGPGSRVYGAPSAKLAWYAEATWAGRVPPNVFWPVPNVESGLVAFARRPAPVGAERDEVFAVIEAAFGQRRKTLRAALAGWAGGADRAAEILSFAGVDPGARGESLSVAEFAAIGAARRERDAIEAGDGMAGGAGVANGARAGGGRTA